VDVYKLLTYLADSRTIALVPELLRLRIFFGRYMEQQ